MALKRRAASLCMKTTSMLVQPRKEMGPRLPKNLDILIAHILLFAITNVRSGFDIVTVNPLLRVP